MDEKGTEIEEILKSKWGEIAVNQRLFSFIFPVRYMRVHSIKHPESPE